MTAPSLQAILGRPLLRLSLVFFAALSGSPVLSCAGQGFSLTFDDDREVFSAHPDGFSLAAMQEYPTADERTLTASGGSATWEISRNPKSETSESPPPVLQLLTETEAKSWPFLRMITDSQSRGFIRLACDGPENSPASFCRQEGDRILMDGGVDFFFRYTEEGPSHPQALPQLLWIAGNLILYMEAASQEGLYARVVADKRAVIFDTDGNGSPDADRVQTDTTRLVQIEHDRIYHLAIAFRTSGNGVTQMQLFLQEGIGPINTDETASLVGSADFTIISRDAERTFPTRFDLRAQSRTSPEKAILDLAAFRVFQPAPAVFPGLENPRP